MLAAYSVAYLMEHTYFFLVILDMAMTKLMRPQPAIFRVSGMVGNRLIVPKKGLYTSFRCLRVGLFALLSSLPHHSSITAQIVVL